MWSLDFFKDLAKIPRPSFYEQQVANYLKEYAECKNYRVVFDTFGNMLVRVPAAGNGVGKDVLAIQAHMDMVCVSECQDGVDFKKSYINVYEQEHFLKAKRTTLGADNGIGIALAFYCASLPHHPPLEILLTVQEEVGMHGAAAVKKNFFTASRLINIDNAREQMLVNGCAGGTTLELAFSVDYDSSFCTCLYIKVSARGLLGGHSGIDIHLGRLSAVQVLTDLLQQLDEKQLDYRLVDIQIGMARNAIASDGFVVLALAEAKDKENISSVKSRLISGAEENVTFLLEEVAEIIHLPLSVDSGKKLLTVMQVLPHGVITWGNKSVLEVVTSNNVAIVSHSEKKIIITTFHRSVMKEELEEVQLRMFTLAQQYNLDMNVLSTSDPWIPKIDSALTQSMLSFYENLYGSDAIKVKTIHAGLECGYWKALYPDIDMISMGPNIYDLHSPQERLDLNSLKRLECWLELAMRLL